MVPLPKQRCRRTSAQPLSNRAQAATCRNTVGCKACRSQHRKVSITSLFAFTTKSRLTNSVTVDLRHNGDAVFVRRKERNAYGRTADEWYVHQQRISRFISMNWFTRRCQRVRYSLFTSTTFQCVDCKCSDHLFKPVLSQPLPECLPTAINQRTYQL